MPKALTRLAVSRTLQGCRGWRAVKGRRRYNGRLAKGHPSAGTIEHVDPVRRLEKLSLIHI